MPPPTQGKKLAGLGVDILSTRRARSFLDRHREFIPERLLAPSEKKFYSKNRLTASRFARLFTAKEAFFKTLNASWMGLAGFAAIEVELRGNRFRAATRGFGGELRRGEGRFIAGRNWVAAEAVRWD